MLRRLAWLVGLALLGWLLTGNIPHPRAREAYDCDPSYPTLCIPVGAPDLSCRDVGATDFPVVGSDPHHFDADHDGIGCESRRRRR